MRLVLGTEGENSTDLFGRIDFWSNFNLYLKKIYVVLFISLKLNMSCY